MGFFAPVWKSNDRMKKDKALKEVRSINSKTKLLRIVREAQMDEIIVAAAKRLTELSVMEPDNVPDEGVLSAVKELTNQSALEHIAKNYSNVYIRSAAVEKLTDQSVIAEIAKNDNKMRYTAAKMLTDKTLAQEILADLIKESPKQAPFLAKHITDQKILAEIAIKAEDYYRKDFRGWRISDEELDRALENVMIKITDQKLLADILKNTGHLSTLFRAASKLTDQEAIAYYVMNMPNEIGNKKAPQWSTPSSNIASQKLAEKAGFVKLADVLTLVM